MPTIAGWPKRSFGNESLERGVLEVLPSRVNGESIADAPRTFEGDEVSWGLVFKSLGKPDRESSTNPFDLLSDAILELTKVAALDVESRCMGVVVAMK
jgi:hypothetical protein